MAAPWQTKSMICHPRTPTLEPNVLGIDVDSGRDDCESDFWMGLVRLLHGVDRVTKSPKADWL
jgi:hypothetical protein